MIFLNLAKAGLYFVFYNKLQQSKADMTCDVFYLQEDN